MTPGPDAVIACPLCNAILRRRTIASGNTFGAVSWTDAKREAPMLPEVYLITRCVSCSHVFWLEDANELGEMWPYGFNLMQENQKTDQPAPVEWAKAPYVPDLDAEMIRNALVATEDINRTFYLRLKLWHVLNDPLRQEDAPERVEGTAEFTSNLDAFAAMLNPDDPDEMLMKAEIMRELGRHAEAIDLLKGIDGPLAEVAGRIAALARVGNTRVAKLA